VFYKMTKHTPATALPTTPPLKRGISLHVNISNC
jgi:hypothetical protein